MFKTYSQDEQIVKRLLNATNHTVASHVIDTLIKVSPPSVITMLYEKVFKGNLARLSVSQTANFAVSNLINRSVSKDMFKQIFEELKEKFSNIWGM